MPRGQRKLPTRNRFATISSAISAGILIFGIDLKGSTRPVNWFPLGQHLLDFVPAAAISQVRTPPSRRRIALQPRSDRLGRSPQPDGAS